MGGWIYCFYFGCPARKGYTRICTLKGSLSLIWIAICFYLLYANFSQQANNQQLVFTLDEASIKQPHVIWNGEKKASSPLDASNVAGDRSTCSFQKVFSVASDHQVYLNASMVTAFASSLQCLVNGQVAFVKYKFATFQNVVVDPSKASGDRKGGENVGEVSMQAETKEYLTLRKGFFSIPCQTSPTELLTFLPRDHLSKWATALTCYNNYITTTNATITNTTTNNNNNNTNTSMALFEGTTIAIQRYEYANLFCSMAELYNTFIMTMLTGADPSHVISVLIVDAHPQGSLDSVWETLYHRVIRAKRLPGPATFRQMVWSLEGYKSPLWDTKLSSVPYLEDFRRFVLQRHNVTSHHVTDCSSLNVVIVWRRDYVAHPRNPSGVVARKFSNEEEILAQVKTTLGPTANVTGVQLDQLTMLEQVRLVSTCDMLIGMHGAGLAHIMFLAPTAGFLEIFPISASVSRTHFHAIGEWRHLASVQFQNNVPNSETPDKRSKIHLGKLHDNVLKLKSKMCAKNRR